MRVGKGKNVSRAGRCREECITDVVQNRKARTERFAPFRLCFLAKVHLDQKVLTSVESVSIDAATGCDPGALVRLEPCDSQILG